MWRTLAKLREDGRCHDRAWRTWLDIQATLPERVETSRDGLTICSVAFRARHCLELNDRLMRQLNPLGTLPTWLLFDNNVDSRESLRSGDRRFVITRAVDGEFTMGYEHAIGISRLLTQVKTRFLLILDPDCFIVMPDWVNRVQRHMIDRDLGFFGTPINPRRHNSYRYFPYMVCMFVDLARVPLRDLCFVPSVWRWPTSATYRIRKAFAGIPKAGAAFRWLLTERYKTNGWRIKERFGDGARVAFECAQPVWDIEEEIRRNTIKRWIHDLTPAAASPIPKRAGYCTPRGFGSAGAPDVAALGWEEFMWRDEPFAFHVGSAHAKTGFAAQLSSVVDAFAHRSGAAIEAARREG